MRVPFNRLSLAGHELKYIHEAIAHGHTSGNGPFTKKCEAIITAISGARQALLTTSCTHALEMAAMLLDIHDGDEVIVPSFTFVSTVNAFVLRGATPVFADIRPDTLNIDERLIEKLITPRTKAIVPVHYAGVGCKMDVVVDVANRYGIRVVEDNAHGLFGKYKGRELGSFGCLGTQSFHETKNISCGEGGALLINDPSMVERAEILREKGTDRSRFFRGLVDKYTWVDLGSSYVLSELLAAFLFGQLEKMSNIQTCRKRLWNRYNTELRAWTASNGVQLPHVPSDCEQSYHMFYLLMASGLCRDEFIRKMRAKDVYCVFHYVPLNASPMGIRLGGREGQCPVAEDVSQRIVRLPFHTGMSEEEQSVVIEAVRGFRS